MPLLILATEKSTERHTGALVLATDLGALDPTQLENDLEALFELGGQTTDAEGPFGLWLLPRGNVRASVVELARSGYRVVWNGEPVLVRNDDGEWA